MLFDTEGRPPPGGYAAPGGPAFIAFQWETGLVTEGTVLVRFWLHISEEEQLRRFRARERDPLKRWKLTGEDWRNLSHRADYEEAVEDMLASTDHPAAPWHVLAAESKH